MSAKPLGTQWPDEVVSPQGGWYFSGSLLISPLGLLFSAHDRLTLDQVSTLRGESKNAIRRRLQRRTMLGSKPEGEWLVSAYEATRV